MFCVQRLAFGGAVLDSEIKQLPSDRASSHNLASAEPPLFPMDAEVADVLRTITAHVVTHTALHDKMGQYRKQRTETPAAASARHAMSGSEYR